MIVLQINLCIFAAASKVGGVGSNGAGSGSGGGGGASAGAGSGLNASAGVGGVLSRGIIDPYDPHQSWGPNSIHHHLPQAYIPSGYQVSPLIDQRSF